MAALIQTKVIDGEMAINLGACVLVASKSQPGWWHVVTSEHCTCEGFAQRGTCRHLTIADRARTVPCHICGAPSRPSEVGVPICGPCARKLCTPPAD
jgi:hypothetical protein